MEIKAREQWRVERLQKTVRLASTILGMDEEQLKSLIHDVDDLQGHLQVFWRHPMTSTQINAFAAAWELCGEKPENTSHRVFW